MPRGNHDPHQVIFAYGMGGFNMRTRGYKPSPSKHRWITSRLIKLGALVVNVNEYNTSQVCSSCFQDTKLCAAGSRQDPFVTPHLLRVQYQLRNHILLEDVPTTPVIQYGAVILMLPVT